MSLPTCAATENVAEVVGKLNGPLLKRPIEPAGRFFQAYFHRRRHNRTISEQETIDLANAAKADVEEELSDDEPESKELLRLDPKYWKEQDHYAVMGLSRLRYRATEEEIKKAFRKKVLKHHPDKKAAQHGGRTDDDAFFKCVQKAYDLLMDPVKRRHFDSVDPTFDEGIPKEKKDFKPEDFFKVYAPVFERNARFSKKQPVPMLGDDSYTLEQVEAFYDFWYNFDSWRVFNYLDEEEGSGGDDKNRDDKRYLDKKNKKAREEKKNDDNKRLRKLVDQALAIDPRIKRLRAEEKARKEREKEAKKQGKDGAAPASSANAAVSAASAAEVAAEAAKQKALKEEEEKKAKADKEAKKKQLQKERKNLRRILKSRNFFLAPDVAADSQAMVDAMTRGDAIAAELPLEELTTLNASMTAAPREAWKVYMAVVSRQFGESAVTPEPEYVEPVAVEDDEEAKPAAKPASKAVEPPKAVEQPKKEEKKPEQKKPEEKKPAAAEEKPKKADEKKPATEEKKPVAEEKKPATEEEKPAKAAPPPWTDKETALLIEAVKKFPGGTISRWQKITKFINEHNPGFEPKREKEVTERAKSIQTMAGVATPTETHIKIEKKHNDTVINDKPTEREAEADPTTPNKGGESSAASEKKAKVTLDEVADDWTKEQMDALQSALRQFPQSIDNRWDRVAEMVPGKTKKEVMSKFKKIALKLKEKASA